MDIGGLTAPNTVCEIYSFPNNAETLVQRPVTIRQVNCMDNSPWCGQINPVRVGVCTGYHGAPITCGSNHYVAGIAVTEFACQAPGTPQNPVVNIVNVADHADWIASVTAETYGSASSKVISVVAMIFGVVLVKVL